MRNIFKFLKFAFITAIIISVSSIALFSCKNDGKIKLLESMVNSDGTSSAFEYDDQNRLIQISYYRDKQLAYTTTFTYSDNSITEESKPAEGDEEYVDGYINYIREGYKIKYAFGNYEGNIDINEDDSLSHSQRIMWHINDSIITYYEYYNDNMHNTNEVTSYNGEFDHQTISVFSYDDKKSPLQFINSPKWLLQVQFCFNDLGLNNNITERIINSTSKHKYEYKYDRDWYPVKQTITDDNGNIKFTTFKYKTANALAQNEITEHKEDKAE